jgi:hypothetical protein
MNLDSGTPVPEMYFLLRDVIGESEVTFEQAAIYTVLAPADLEAAKTYDVFAGDLLDLPELAGWTLPETIIQKFADALQEAESSQIVISPTMQRERQNELYEQAMEEALGERSRRIMRLRLEETAYYFWQTDRRREALWAVAAAQSLLEENSQRLRHNPFAGALLERSLEGAKQRSSSRIILPFSQSPRPTSSSSESRLIVP